MQVQRRWIVPTALLSALMLMAGVAMVGCGNRASAAPAAPPPPQVAVVTVTTEDVPLYEEFAAQTYARDLVEVRGRVDGYIEQRAFQIGSPVKAGQVLYLLDRRPYQAEVARASGEVAQVTADLAQSAANLVKARQDVERLKPLVQEEAAARQDLDNAQAALEAAEATVNARKASIEAARASLRTAELNLEYATIRAPIAGRIGDSLLQVGGLVTRTSAQPLTTIVPLDAIWVRFKIGEAQTALFQRRDARDLPITLLLPDGSTWPHEGRIQNTLNQVDAKTGTLEVQVKFPNPDGALLPGQFGRVRVRTAERRNAVLVPQKAVQELQGLQSVLTLGPQNAVQLRSIVTGDRVGERWIVEQGLVAGDTVVVEGLQKARPGAKVTPRPYASASASALRATADKPATRARGDEE
jgi:membrane fusion protein (multidrug efflux system)